MTKTDIDFAEGRANNRKEWIDKMIAESKARKLEKQRDQEETDTRTRVLDGEWKSICGKLMAKRKKPEMQEVRSLSLSSLDFVL